MKEYNEELVEQLEELKDKYSLIEIFKALAVVLENSDSK